MHSESNSNCGVCLEDFKSDEMKILDCCHKLCNNCLPKLRKKECPFCRTKITCYEQENDIISNVSQIAPNYQSSRARRRNPDRIRRQRTSTHQLIGIFYIDDTINDRDKTLISQRKTTKKECPKKSEIRRNYNSNRWNDISRQHTRNM